MFPCLFSETCLFFFFFIDPCDTVSCEYYGTCRLGPNHAANCVCQKSCPESEEPVCGSDGQTYNNECLMKQNSCNKHVDIQLVVRAPCGRLWFFHHFKWLFFLPPWEDQDLSCVFLLVFQ